MFPGCICRNMWSGPRNGRRFCESISKCGWGRGPFPPVHSMRPETRSTRDLRFGLLLCLVFFLFFESIYLGMNYVTELRSARLHLYSSLELAIPFLPQMALVYLSLNVMLALTPFVLRSWRDIIPLCMVMTGETL